jgi:hypothetical protein
MSLFDLFRRLLVITVVCYSTVQLASFIWRWRVTVRSPDRPRRLMARYLELNLLRTRILRFSTDLAQVAILAAVLVGLILMQA